MQSLNESNSNIWVTPQAIGALIQHVLRETPGICGLAAAGHNTMLTSKTDLPQAIVMTKEPQGLIFEVFVIMKRGSPLEALTKEFAERLRTELAHALEQPVAEVLIRIQAMH